jgi:hypothetical protein
MVAYMPLKSHVSTVLWMLLLATAITVPSLVNGWPFVFPDSLQFLGRVPLIFRSYEYQYPARLLAGFDVWAIVVLQAVLISFMMCVTLRFFAPRAGSTMMTTIILALTVASSLPYFSSLLMPDFFTSIMILLICIIGLHSPLSPGRTFGFGIALAIALVMHSSNYVTAAVMIPIVAVINGIVFRSRGRLVAAVLPLCVTVICAVGVVFGTNVLIHGEKTLSGPGKVFLMANLIESGPALKFLDQSCPRYAICKYRDELAGATTNDILWDENILKNLGGFEGAAAEAGDIVAGTLRNDPAAVIGITVKNILRALATSSPAAHVGSAIAYPWVPVAVRSELGEREYLRYAASLQARGLWPVKLLADVNRILLPVIWATLIVLAMLSWREGDRIGTGLIAIITAAYVTNAAVCATFSGVYARYQARLSWLFLFAALILLARLRVGAGLAHRASFLLFPRQTAFPGMR